MKHTHAHFTSESVQAAHGRKPTRLRYALPVLMHINTERAT